MRAQEDIGRREEEEEDYVENRFRFGQPQVMYCSATPRTFVYRKSQHISKAQPSRPSMEFSSI